MELRDKVAVITGGGSGLGRAAAVALAEAGARILVVDVDPTGGGETARLVDGAFFRADVSDLDENRAMFAEATRHFGRLDLAYLNAGVSSGFGVDDSFDLAAYRRVMGVNLDGVVFGTHAFLGARAEQGTGGAIVATASLAGLTSVPFDPIYAANKHAVVGLARSLGPALADRGVRFNAVCPGFAETKIIAPIREGLVGSGMPIIAPEKVAGAVLELFAGEMTGECWFVQAGREPGPFNFRGIPGPRLEEAHQAPGGNV